MAIKGLVRPPADIRAVADKTALYVSKKGRAFESRILNSAKGKTPQFAFLHESSPFHAYYEDKIRFYEEGGTDNDNKKTTPAATASDDKNKKEGNNTSGEKQVQDQQQQSNTNNNNNNGKTEESTVKDENDTDAAKNKESYNNVLSTKSYQASAVDPVARSLLSQRSYIATQRNIQRELALAEQQKLKEQEEKNQDGVEKEDLLNKNKLMNRGANNSNTSNEEKNKSKDYRDYELKPPPTFQFVSLMAPSSCTPAQLDVMKLVAQFTAFHYYSQQQNNNSSVSSESIEKQTQLSFLKELMRREWNNPTLGFLQPRHPSFPYFTALVDCYKRILSTTFSSSPSSLNPTKEEKDDKKEEIGDKKKSHDISLVTGDFMDSKNLPKTTLEFLDIAAYRAEYERDSRERTKLLQQQQQDGDPNGGDFIGGGISAAAFVDWHDFVVVETIDFDMDEVVEYLPPPSLSTETNKTAASNDDQDAKNKNNNGEGEGSDMEEDSDVDMETDDDSVDASNKNDGEVIKIDTNYQPRIISQKSTLNDPSRKMVLDPITNQMIPIENTSEHLRIQLLDPKWAEEKKKFQEKQKESNFVREGSDIARNISKFLEKRTGGTATDNNDTSSSNNNQVGVMLPPPPPPSVLPPPPPTGAMIPPPPTNIMGHAPMNMSIPPPPPGMMMDMTGQQPPPPPVPRYPQTYLPPPPPHQGLSSVPPPPPMSFPPPPTQHLQSNANVGEKHNLTSLPQQEETNEPMNKKPRLDDNTGGDDSDTPKNNDTTPVNENTLPPQSKQKPLPEIASVSIQVPTSSSNNFPESWNLQGQTLKFPNLSTSTMTIKSLKEMAQQQLGGGIPMNKIQLKDSDKGIFLKDRTTLRDSGVSISDSAVEDSVVVLDMVPKIRGGRK